MIGYLAVAMYLAGQTPAPPPEPVAPGSVVEQMKTEAVHDLGKRAFKSMVVLLVAMAAMLFLPAFTLRYWQGCP